MPQHRPIHLVQQILVDVYDVVGADAQQPLVIRGVVDLAQAEAIRDDRVAAGLAVLDDVSGVQQLGMLE